MRQSPVLLAIISIFLYEGGHRFLDQVDILAASPWPRSSSTPALTCAWLFYWFAPTMLGVTAGMNQKEFYVVGAPTVKMKMKLVP